MTGTRTLRLAHRGDWRAAHENTLAAFAAAMAVPGCDGVEFDVRLSGDGIPVVLHDETLTRVQRRHARVDELSAAECGAHAIPTLATTLAALPPGAWLDVELKGEAHGDATADVLRAAGPDNLVPPAQRSSARCAWAAMTPASAPPASRPRASSSWTSASCRASGTRGSPLARSPVQPAVRV